MYIDNVVIINGFSDDLGRIALDLGGDDSWTNILENMD